MTGLFYGDSGQLFAQLVGVVTLLVWAFGGTFLFMKLQDMFMGIRVSAEAEIEGLDIPEMGTYGYEPGGVPGAGGMVLQPEGGGRG